MSELQWKQHAPRGRMLTAALAALLFAANACGPDQAEQAKRFADAQRLYAAGDRDAAAGILREIVKADADHVPAHIMLGKIDFLTAKADQARAHFEAAHHAQPENLDALLWLARVRGHEGRDVKGALAALDQVLAVDGGNAEAWYLKGTLHERLGQVEEALAAYRYGLENRKHLVRIYVRLAAVYARADLRAEAERYLQDAATLAKDDAYLRREVDAARAVR